MIPFILCLEKAKLERKARGYQGLGVGVDDGHKRIFGVIELFYISILMVIIQLHGFIKSHRSVPGGDGTVARAVRVTCGSSDTLLGAGIAASVRTLRPRGMPHLHPRWLWLFHKF